MREIENRTLASTLFHLLSDEEWESLREHMDLRSFEPGDVLVEQGTIEPPFQVIVEGVASVVATNSQGERRELGRLGFGECIGEMSLLTGDPASADVVAATPVQTYAATPTRLAGLGELRSRLIEALSATLAGRLKHANERLLALHPARNHVICCGPEDMPVLAGLPGALARTTDARVMVLVTGESMVSASQRAHVEARNVTIRLMDDAEMANLPTLLQRMAHEFDEIVLLGGEEAFHQIAPDAASVLHVARETGGTYVRSQHESGGQLIVVSQERWTQPALRRLTARLGRPVVAILPPDVAAAAQRAPVAKLARVMTHRQVGLALGAGAAKGLAHLGVLRALDELAVPIDVVTGCSIGSAVAAGIAAGMTADELMEATARVASRAVRPTLPIRSFLSNAGIKEELKHLSGERRIEDLDLPLAVIATDLFRRTAVTFTSGLLWPRLLASMAIPGVYPPSAAMGSYLVDGSVLHPVPVRQCRELGAGLVIGVRLTGSRTSPRDNLNEKPERPLAIETIMRSLEIMVNHLSEVSHENADVNIEVCIEGGGGVRDFKRGDEIAGAGYRTVIAAAPVLTEAMPYIATEATLSAAVG
jgi:NTE family protein